jgi:3D (Asp-Asp-Asp) domain-containing protein
MIKHYLVHASLLLSALMLCCGGMIIAVSAQATEPEFTASEPVVQEPPKAPKHLHMLATAYCSCKKCCGKRARGVTKTGTRATYGTIAVDPRVLALKSQITIVGMGEYRCEDTGRKIKGNRVDIWMPTHWSAKHFGKKRVVVELED